MTEKTTENSERADALGAAVRGATYPCTLGVGCDEAGVCYADAHGQPEQCPHHVGVQPSRAQSLAQRVDDLHNKAGMPLEQARELALSESGITADNQWFGDMMILQVLADSEHVNDQEREVLTRWLAASQPPDVPAPPAQ